MATLLMTGFPGFLGSELLPRILGRAPEQTALCLVQAKFAEMARRRVGEIEAAHPALAGRIRLAEGDITAPGLGLANGAELARDVVEIYHLAAVYDLAVPRPVAMKVNVDGTRHTLDFAESCPGLQRLHYISTCYISGRGQGVFTEDDLEHSNPFNNFYEETKYLAEVDVQARMKGGMPGTVYRPAIVVGDSKTGATQKFDGPYYVIRWLLKQPAAFAVMPMAGNGDRHSVNIVPSDFAISALAHLSGLAASRGRVYQLADPAPLTVNQILAAIKKATGRRVFAPRLPKWLAKGAIQYVPGVYRLMEIPAPAVDYFVHAMHYTSEHTQQDLAGSGITCPPFASYAQHLADFVRAHPEIESKAMV